MAEIAISNLQEASAILRRNLSPRARDLEVLERFVDGTQYEGLPDWFTADAVPLWERAPCIVYKITATAIRSNVDLIVGEARFPAVSSNPGEDDSEAEGLDEEQSRNVDRAIADLFTRTRFRSVARQALEHAQGARSVATIVGVRNGRPFLELVRSRYCTPTFDADGNVTRLEVSYPYCSAPEKQYDGTWKVFVRLYRRIIDDKADTTFLPLPADKDGKEPKPEAWEVDKSRTVAHGLGFCPVRWYAHMKACDTIANFDGVAIHERELGAIRGLDFTLSQRHRAVLYTGDPQIIEIGVEPGYNPSSGGRTAVMPSTLAGGEITGTNPITGAYVDTTTRPARRKGPGEVWQYEATTSKDVRVEYLTLPPGSLDALDEHAADLRNKICEGLCAVILDPENVKFTGDMSGKAIEQLRSRQFDRCDQIRDDFGENWIRPVTLMLLRVALGTKLRSPAVDSVRDVLEQYVSDDASAPMLFVRWPTGYTQPDPTDEQTVIGSAAMAYEKGLATRRAAVEKVAKIFGYSNVDQAVEAIEEEAAERQRVAMETAAAMAKPKPGDGKRGEGKPAADPNDDGKDGPKAKTPGAKETSE